MYDDAPVSVRDGERERVDSWKLARLVELGFTPPVAEELVRRGVDWHDAAHLVCDLGCPLEQALEILV